MLNGVAPVIVFQVPKLLPLPALSELGKIPILKGLSVPGIPIPLYLDERLTGLAVDEEVSSLTVDTNPQFNHETKKTDYAQKGVENTVTVNLKASPNSAVLSVLLAFLDMVFEQLVETDYSITYINGTTILFGGLLSSFSKNVGANDNLIRLNLQLQKRGGATPEPNQTIFPNLTPTPGTQSGPSLITTGGIA